MRWLIVALIAIAVASANLQVTMEFEGPLHQLYVDHIRHHQIEIQKKQNSF